MALALPKPTRLWKFLFLFCLCYFLETITFTYLVSAVQSIERQFQIPSQLSGTLVASSDIGYIPTVVLLAHFGSKGNRPRWIGFGCLLISLACLMISIPGLTVPAQFSSDGQALNTSALESSMPKPLLLYREIDQPSKLASHPQVGCAFGEWLLRSGLPLPSWATSEGEAETWNQASCSGSNQSVGLHFDSSLWEDMASQLKDNMDYGDFAKALVEKVNAAHGYSYAEGLGKEGFEGLLKQAARPQPSCSRLANHFRAIANSSKCKTDSTNGLAFAVVLLGIILIGVGHSMPWTLGMPLIDDSVKRHSMPYYIGGVLFIRILGPVLGFLVGSVCNRLYYKLSVDPEIEPTDVQWIGAWWLGFLAIAVVLFLPSLALFFFPHVDLNGADDKSAKGSPTVAVQQNQTVAVKTVHDSKQSAFFSSLALELTTLLQSLWLIIRVPVYTFALCGRMLDVLAFKGFFVFHSKYLEIHYGLPQYKANAAMGLAGSFGFGLGNVVGGFLMRKLNLEGRKAAVYITTCGVISVLLSFVKLALGCTSTLSQLGKLGRENNFNFSNSCNGYCHCDNSMLLPVCSSSGTTYFSPCHAGCHSSVRVGSVTTFTDCFCADNATVASRYCQDDCEKPFMTYIFLAAVTGIVAGSAMVPGLLIVLRAVPAHLKSLSLGFGAFLVSLLSTLPSPILYGYVIDGTCLLWRESCGQRGSCSIYDTDDLRLRYFSLHGGLRVIAVLFDIGVFYYAKNLKLLGESEAKAGEGRLSTVDSTDVGKKASIRSEQRQETEKKDSNGLSEQPEQLAAVSSCTNL